MSGLFIISELCGAARDTIHAVHERHDPRLAAASTPHITLAGSSGVGPIVPGTTLAELSEKLQPVADATAPIAVRFGIPMRFMQTEIIVLPLDPHGPLRALHERIATSGLRFQSTRYPFTPHCTLSFYPTGIPAARRQELFAVRLEDELVIDRIQVYQTADPFPSKRVLEVELRGSG